MLLPFLIKINKQEVEQEEVGEALQELKEREETKKREEEEARVQAEEARL